MRVLANNIVNAQSWAAREVEDTRRDVARNTNKRLSNRLLPPTLLLFAVPFITPSPGRCCAMLKCRSGLRGHVEGRVNALMQGFTVENDTMTPTFKLRRPQLLRRYAREVQQMYDALRAPPPADGGFMSPGLKR